MFKTGKFGFAALCCLPLLAADDDNSLTGVQADGRIRVPTNQFLTPAGKQIAFGGRPVDMIFTPDGSTLVVKSQKTLILIDVATGAKKQGLGDSPGFSVVGLAARGRRIYASDAFDSVACAELQDNGKYDWSGGIDLKKPADDKEVDPAGMAFDSSGNLWVTSTRGNNVQCIGRKDKIEDVVKVGVAPFTIVFVKRGDDEEKGYVSNWGGDPPAAGEPQSKSSGTFVHIEPNIGYADRGSVSVLQRADGRWKQVKTIQVGLHPSGMIANRAGTLLFVANANSDSVSVVGTAGDTVVETISCRPEKGLPFGSGCNALALSPDERTLYVANGTNNCIAVVRLGKAATVNAGAPPGSTIEGLIPTGWYPGAVLASPDGNKLYVANVKGHGSVNPSIHGKGKRVLEFVGSISVIDVPDSVQLAKYTAAVDENNRLAYSLAGLSPPRPDAKALPIPERHGEPSVFKHVIYVIKENRTYDQVFGDMKEGNGDPHLAIFGENVTPNQHAMARQFTLLDNFYCSGALSADGHQWVTQSYCTDYLERSFGAFTRSYPDKGDDPLAYAPVEFLWDNALAHGKTLRNMGEFVKTSYAKHVSWKECYKDFLSGRKSIQITAKPTLKQLEPYTHPSYPSFVLTTPDVVRASLFIEELKSWEEKGTMPDLTYVYLPCDHTSGATPDMPTPRASVADNDAALGEIVEAVSHSKFWAQTCIFVVEDDAQDGFDHVDGHRTIAQAISAYTRRGFVDHTNYNQTSMVKTIELILGLPATNQMDLSATPMRNCFQETADLTPYTWIEHKIALDEMNKSLNEAKGKKVNWAKKSLELDFSEPDLADEDTLNRIIWHTTVGDDVPYPEEFAARDDD